MLTPLRSLISVLLLANGSGSALPTPSSDGSDIGVTIMGTIVQKKTENNVALIKETKTGKVQAVKVGYLVLSTHQVVEISGKYMVILKDGQKRLIYQDKFAREFAEGALPATPPPNPLYSGATPDKFKEDGFERQNSEITMSAAYRDKLVNQDMAQILMQATAEPHLENGRIVGFKLTQIDAGSIYWKGGLKDEDVITEINGQKLDSVAKAVMVLKTIKQEGSIEVQILRGGSPSKLSLRVN